MRPLTGGSVANWLRMGHLNEPKAAENIANFLLRVCAGQRISTMDLYSGFYDVVLVYPLCDMPAGISFQFYFDLYFDLMATSVGELSFLADVGVLKVSISVTHATWM